MKKAEEEKDFLRKEEKPRRKKESKEKTLEEKTGFKEKDSSQPKKTEKKRGESKRNNKEDSQKEEDFFLQQKVIEIPVTSLENNERGISKRLEKSLPLSFRADDKTTENRKSEYRFSSLGDNPDKDYEIENSGKTPFFSISNTTTNKEVNNREFNPELRRVDFESPFKEILKKDEMYVSAKDNENFPFFKIERGYNEFELRQ